MRVRDLLLVSQPLEELLERPELAAGVCGAVSVQQPGDPLLHVSLARLLPPGAAGIRERAGGGGQVQPERVVQMGESCCQIGC
jgi:hypothetical protein